MKDIRELNDEIRQGSLQDIAMLLRVPEGKTSDEFKRLCLAAVSSFSDFDQVDDPYGRREAGRIEVEGRTLFFKILHFNRTMSDRSPNEMSDEESRRVLLVHD